MGLSAAERPMESPTASTDSDRSMSDDDAVPLRLAAADHDAQDRMSARSFAKTKRRRRAAWTTVPSSVGFAVKRLIRPQVMQLLEWFIGRLERLELNGILVIFDSDDPADRERIRAGVSEALEKLTAWSPRMRRRLESKVHRILVDQSNVATYSHPGTITIPLEVLQNGDSDAVAGYFVHEAVHERFEARGIRYWPHLRARMERRCLHEQIAFLTSRGRTDLASQFEQYQRRRWPED
jgi:hypothetical protein